MTMTTHTFVYDQLSAPNNKETFISKLFINIEALASIFIENFEIHIFIATRKNIYIEG